MGVALPPPITYREAPALVRAPRVRIVGMATSNLPSPTLQPIAEEKNLLTVIESDASSCCGGGSCSIG